MFSLLKYKAVTCEEMNEHLKFCNENKIIVEGAPDRAVGPFAFIEDYITEFHLTYQDDDGKNCTYICRKDDEFDSIVTVSGLEAFRILNKYYNVPRTKFPGTEQHSSSGFLYYNPKYNNERISDCYGYDLNSSYSFAMCQDMPDTSIEPRCFDYVKENEIGFDSDYDLCFEGDFAKYIYPKMESPFKKFVNVWYKKKKTAKTKQEKVYAKFILNASIGYLQRVNPILRTAILWYANKKVKDAIDENTLYCNTDSIISMIKRNDFDIGDNLGQWKIEHHGDFAYKNYTYQWNLEIPAYRGISKKWFIDGWDVLKDEPPRPNNNWIYDKETNILKRMNYEKI